MVTGDGNGVPMRRPPADEARSHASRRGKGEKESFCRHVAVPLLERLEPDPVSRPDPTIEFHALHSESCLRRGLRPPHPAFGHLLPREKVVIT